MTVPTSSPIVRVPAALAVAMAIACGGGGRDSTEPGPSGPGPSGGSEKATHPTGSSFTSFQVSDAPYGIALTPNGTTLVTLYPDGRVARFPLAAPSATPPKTDVGPWPSDIVVDPTGQFAFVALGDGVRDLNVATGVAKPTIRLDGYVNRVVLSADGARLYAAGQTHAWLVPVGAGAPSAVLLSGTVASVALSPTGNAVYAANSGGQLWRLHPATLAIEATGAVSGSDVGDVLVSPDGTRLFVVDLSGKLIVVSAATLATIASVDVPGGSSLMRITPDSAQIYVTSNTGWLTVVDRAQLSVVWQRMLGGRPRHVAFDVLGKTALVANENERIEVIR